MRKKSILMVCISALIALAVFVGCDNAPVYPSWPTGGFIQQKVDMLEGQVIPTNAFDVYATYIDGAKTIKNVAVTEADETTANGKANNGESISYYVGLDYYGNEVYAKGQISAYPVNRIEAVVADGVVPELNETLASTELRVTAYYTNAAGDEISQPVATADITNVTKVTPDADADMTAATVPASFDVTALGITCTVEVTVATIPAEPVTEIDSAEFVSGVDFASLDYTETGLPDLEASMVVVNSDKVSGSYVEGLELEFVNNTTKLPLNEELGEYNFKEFKDIAVAVTLNDTTLYLPVIPATTTVSVQVKSSFEALVIGSDVPAIDPSDFVVTLNVNGKYSILDLDAEAFDWYTNNAVYEGTTVQSRMAVQVNYMGVVSNVAEVKTVEPEAETVVTGIAFTLKEGTVGPAKQIYTTAPVFDESSVDTVTITTKKGKEAPVTTTVAAPYDGFTFEYSTSKEPVTPLKDGIQITESTEIFVVATYEDQIYAVSVPTTKAVATDITLSAEYESAVTSKITWTVATVNENGIVAILEDGYTVWSDGETTNVELPENVTDKEQGPFVVTYGEFQSEPVTIAAGDGYVTPKEGGFKVSLTAVKPMIGNPVSGNAADYSVDEDSWDPTATGVTPEPEVYSIRKAVSDQKYEATSKVYARVSYVDSTGETKISDEIEVEITGINWTEEDSIALSYSGEEPLDIEAGKLYFNQTYDVSKFAYDSNAVVNHGQNTVKYLGYVSGTYDPETSVPVTTGTFGCDWAELATPNNFIFQYTNEDGVTTEKVITLTYGYAPTN